MRNHLFYTALIIILSASSISFAQESSSYRVDLDSIGELTLSIVTKEVSEVVKAHAPISDSLQNVIIYSAIRGVYFNFKYKLCDSLCNFYVPEIIRGKDTLHLLRIKHLQTRCYNRLGRYTEEIETLIQAKRVSDSFGDVAYIERYNRRLAWLNFYIGNLDRSSTYISYLDTMVDSDNVNYGRLCNLKGSIEQKKNNFNEAIEFYSIAMKVALAQGSAISEAVYRSNRASAYLDIDSLDLAERDIKLAIQQNRKSQNQHQLAGNMAIWSNVKEKRGDLKRAVEIAEQALQSGKKVESFRSISSAYSSLHRFHKKLGNFKKAYGYLDTLYRDYNDYRNYEESDNILTKIYDSELNFQKKELNLLARERQLNNLKIAQHEQDRWILLLGALLLVASLIVYFYRRQSILTLENQNIEQQYEKEILEIEMKALRSQMNPHFLFNSLNSIKNYIVKNDARVATKYLNKFSKLMRLILNHSKERYITVQDEVDAVSVYMDLEQMRFSDNFDYHISIHDSVNNQALVPPMTLQPFIENSVWHAFNGLKRKGSIEINVSRESGYLVLVVADDGIGRSKAIGNRKINIKAHKGMGVEITTHRIESISNNNLQGSVEISDNDSSDGLGTKVVIKIPYFLEDQLLT